MLGTIFAIYLIVGLIYWASQGIKFIPSILKWAILILMLPFLLPIALIKSLPLYLKKDGKWYKWRWVVYLNFIMYIVIIIISFIPPTPPKPVQASTSNVPIYHLTLPSDSSNVQSDSNKDSIPYQK